MSSSSQNSSYLPEQKKFPYNEIQDLTVQIDRAYVDIAQKMNVRTIGLFAQNNEIVTGEQWFVDGFARARQTLRKMFVFTAYGSIAHGINTNNIAGFTRIYGTIYDGTNYYPLPYVDVVSATNQVSIVVTPTNIVITAGGGSPPAVVSGFCVLEWLSNV